VPLTGWPRRILIELPARSVNAAGLGYAVLVLALSLVSLTGALIWLLVWLAGYPLP
jgi:hypothetical protein